MPPTETALDPRTEPGSRGSARAILRRALPGEWRDDILRDLEEAFRDRWEHRGGVRARAWLWRHVISFSPRFLPSRLAEGLPVPRAVTSLDVKLALRCLVRSPGLSVLTVVFGGGRRWESAGHGALRDPGDPGPHGSLSADWPSPGRR